MIIVDAHQDLAYNALVDGRNYLLSAYDTRMLEEGSDMPEFNGQCMLGMPEWLRGQVAVIFATLFTMPREAARPGELGYPNPQAAHQQAYAQLNLYRKWVAEEPRLRLVTHQEQLEAVLASWADDQPEAGRLIGLVLLMENAVPVRRPHEIRWWYEQGVRLVGPAWNSSNRYTGSTQEPGPLSALGKELLQEMAKVNMILDISHMADQAALEALDIYPGAVVATHANPRRLVNSSRMLPDEVIEKIVEKDGVVGIMPANWALKPAWQVSSGKDSVILNDVVTAVSAVCQIAGDAYHVGLGTDFDGGFGAESVPAELDTIADLPRLADALSAKGFSDEYVAAVMGGNWLRLLLRHLPRETAKVG